MTDIRIVEVKFSERFYTGNPDQSDTHYLRIAFVGSGTQLEKLERDIMSFLKTYLKT